MTPFILFGWGYQPLLKEGHYDDAFKHGAADIMEILEHGEIRTTEYSALF